MDALNLTVLLLFRRAALNKKPTIEEPKPVNYFNNFPWKRLAVFLVLLAITILCIKSLLGERELQETNVVQSEDIVNPFLTDSTLYHAFQNISKEYGFESEIDRIIKKKQAKKMLTVLERTKLLMWLRFTPNIIQKEWLEELEESLNATNLFEIWFLCQNLFLNKLEEFHVTLVYEKKCFDNLSSFYEVIKEIEIRIGDRIQSYSFHDRLTENVVRVPLTFYLDESNEYNIAPIDNFMLEGCAMELDFYGDFITFLMTHYQSLLIPRFPLNSRSTYLHSFN